MQPYIAFICSLLIFGADGMAIQKQPTAATIACCPEPCNPASITTAPPPTTVSCVCASASPCVPQTTFGIDKTSVLQKMANVAQAGLLKAKVLTAKLSAPLVLLNGKIAAGAAKIPVILASGGALAGKAIALPIKAAAALNSAATVAANGILVGVPVGLGTAAVAGAVGAADVVQQKLGSVTTGCDTNPCPPPVPAATPCPPQ